MDMQIKGHGVTVSEELRKRVEETIGHLNKFEAHIVNIEVTLTVEKERHKASATVNIPHKSFHIEKTTDNMYESIDKLNAALKIELNEYRSKQIDQRNHPRSKG